MATRSPSLASYHVLSKDAIWEAIDCECRLLNGPTNPWKLSRATTSDFRAFYEETQPQQVDQRVSKVDDTLLFGIVAVSLADELANPSLVTFYFSYSTWDGRFLYLDHMDSDEPVSQPSSETELSNLSLLFRRAIAGVTLRLNCSRLTWQHYDTSPKYPVEIQPEYLDGWLTLHWGSEDMNVYLQNHGIGPDTDTERPLVESTAANIRKSIEKCLEDRQQESAFNLSLAKSDDVGYIGRLVQGLAIYEMEPDAVNVTSEHYLRDGFEGHPLFHCLLIHHNGENGEVKTCGMAFCYIGFTLSKGLFLYLEDLFIEESFRGKGAGTLAMQTLASIGTSLGCSRLVWQALVSCIGRMLTNFQYG